MAPKVTAITVISGNDIAFMGSCLRSLVTITAYDNLEIIVVCDADQDTKDYLTGVSASHQNIHTLFRERKSGNASNRNAGAAQGGADAEYLLFCDSDVLFSDPNWLRQLVHILEENPSIGMVGSNNGTALGHFCWIDPTSGLLINNVMDFAGVLPDYPVEMMAIPGCCMLIRNSLFEQVGGWDEGFFPVYGEDIDLCLRCILAGAHVFSLHNSGVVHLYRDSGRNNSCERLSDDRRLWLTVASCRRLALKYAGVLPVEPARSYQNWLSMLQSTLYGHGLTRHFESDLPPTVTSNRLNSLYLPIRDREQVGNIYKSIVFDY